jgi:hexosaminidase
MKLSLISDLKSAGEVFGRGLKRSTVFVCATLLLHACGGAGKGALGNSSKIAVVISPANATVMIQGAEQFSANLIGGDSGSILWMVDGEVGGNTTVGTISQTGLFRAPSAIPPNRTVTIKAVSGVDSSGAAVAKITIESPVPATIPAVRRWRSEPGLYELGSHSRIVLDPQFFTELQPTASLIADELKVVVGSSLEIVRGLPISGDISLSLDSPDSNLGDEGYCATISDHLSISARTPRGAFYATRTLLQLLSRDRRLPAGEICDWPDYPERGLMVDVGRKYFTIDWLRQRVKEIAFVKLNTLHLHLTDDSAFRIESASHPELNQGVSALYSKSELRELTAFAAKYHVTIIPEIELPAHSGGILKFHPELVLRPPTNGTYYGAFDISVPGTYALVSDILNEYLDLFPGPYWHTGTDEYLAPKDFDRYPQFTAFAKANIAPNANAYDTYLWFINWINSIVKSHGKTTRIWVCHDFQIAGDATTLSGDISLEEYCGELPSGVVENGYTYVNASYHPTYYVVGLPYTDGSSLYDKWTPAGQLRVSASDSHLKGAMFEIWVDHDVETEDSIALNTLLLIRALAQNTWSTTVAKTAPNFEQFRSLSDQIGPVPETGQGHQPEK